MKPLRPHNYYGGTTCPGKVTGQVDTIRSLILEPEEDEMTPEQMAELKRHIDVKVQLVIDQISNMPVPTVPAPSLARSDERLKALTQQALREGWPFLRILYDAEHQG